MNPGKTFVWLLKRELWEYRGAMLWAPIIVAIVMVLLLAVGFAVGGILGHNTVMEVNGVPVSDLASALGEERLKRVVAAVGIGLLGSAVSLLLIPAFVVFFYSLGALFNDRQDRSMLFWKSLPVSDSATVLAKLVTALVIAPLIALVVAAITNYVLLALTAIAGLLLGGGMNLVQGLFQGTLLAAPFQMAAMLPLYVLWALPTVGWLLMVSAWARGKPFLWAVGVPLAAGVLLVWANYMLGLRMDLSWYWRDVVARGLVGTVPGGWFGQLRELDLMMPIRSLGDMLAVSTQMYAQPGLWVGAALGAGMVAVAIRLRRWRDAE